MVRLMERLPWRSSLACFAVAEVSFYLLFRLYFVPKANRRQPVRKIRNSNHDYDTNRHHLLCRILDRIDRKAKDTNQDTRAVFIDFLDQYFQKKTHEGHKDSLLDASSPETSNGEENEELSVRELRKEDIDSLFAWAFFGKEPAEMNTNEQEQLQRMWSLIEERHQIKFPSGGSSGQVRKARRPSLEDVNPLHRPFMVYLTISFMEKLGGAILRLHGFRRHETSPGQAYWHRPGVRQSNRLPLLFFHGIAPAGHLFYIPIMLYGLGDRERSMFLFDNKSISSSINFNALSEDETVDGVAEALDRHLQPHESVSLIGHSFGSCPLTWLLHSSLKNRIKQFTLLDPVTILLSEPDVMVNFLYSRMEDLPGNVNRTKIQLVAGSELFTEYYLRRHFWWYNSELWLDDISEEDSEVLVCLSERDEIICAPKVKQEIEYHKRENIHTIYWEKAGHAKCITTPVMWWQIRESMLEQERKVLKRKSE